MLKKKKIAINHPFKEQTWAQFSIFFGGDFRGNIWDIEVEKHLSRRPDHLFSIKSSSWTEETNEILKIRQRDKFTYRKYVGNWKFILLEK